MYCKISISLRGELGMPRAKVYTSPRARICFRIDEEKYNAALTRSKELGFATFNKYLESLLDDDLLLQQLQEKRRLLKEAKGVRK